MAISASATRLPGSFNLYGTIPHSLNAVFGGSSIESAAAYLEKHPDVPLTVLLDFEGPGRRRSAPRPPGASAISSHPVRIDTPANRIFQGGTRESASRPGDARSLAGCRSGRRHGRAEAIRGRSRRHHRVRLSRARSARLDGLQIHQDRAQQRVQPGQGPRVPRRQRAHGLHRHRLVWVAFSTFTSDIIRVFEDGQWVDRCKAGRREELIEIPELPVTLQK